MSHIDGPGLLGFGDFFSSDNVGSADRGYGSEIGGFEKPDKSKNPPPVQLRPYPKRTQNSQTRTHGKVMSAAKSVLNKGVRSTMKAVAKIASPLVRVTVPGAKNLTGRRVIMGAAAAVMTNKQKLAVAKHNKAVETSKKARQILARQTVNQKKVNNELAKKVIAQKKMSKLLRTPLKKRGASMGELLADPYIGEEVGDALREYYDAVGQEEGEALPQEGAPLVDADLEKEMAALDKDTNVLDSGVETDMAKLEKLPMDLFFTADKRQQLGGIVYDGSKGKPDGSVGSYGLFTRETDRSIIPSWLGMGVDGVEHHGFVWGKYDKDNNKVKGIPWGDQLQSNAWNRVRGRHNAAGQTIPFDVVDENQVIVESKPGGNPIPPPAIRTSDFGPIIGNPEMADFKGMRMDDTGVFFWLPNEAPSWLTAVLAMAAALTAKAAKDAEDQRKKLEAAARLKDQADREAAKAASDAENALAEGKAASTAKVAQAEEGTKQAATETQAQQALVQQQQAETEQYGAEAAQMKEAGGLMLAQAKRQEEYYAKHPEAEYGPAEEGEEEGAFESDSMEDGSPTPGGDLMQDSGGEEYQESEE